MRSERQTVAPTITVPEKGNWYTFYVHINMHNGLSSAKAVEVNIQVSDVLCCECKAPKPRYDRNAFAVGHKCQLSVNTAVYEIRELMKCFI